MFYYFKFLSLSIFFFTIGYVSKVTYVFPVSITPKDCKDFKIKTKIINIKKECKTTEMLKEKTTNIKKKVTENLDRRELDEKWKESLKSFFKFNFKKNKSMGKVYAKITNDFKLKKDKIEKKIWDENKVDDNKSIYFQEYKVDIKLINLELQYFNDLKKALGGKGFKKLLSHIHKQNQDALERAKLGYKYIIIKL